MPNTNLDAARARFIPKGADLRVCIPLKAEIYLYEDAEGRPCAKGFKGRKVGPVFNHYFGSEEKRETFVNGKVSEWQADAKRKAERRSEANQPHSLKVGDILYSSWGYEQTNVDFFKVVRLAGKTMIEVTELACESVQATGGMSDTVIASNRELGGSMRRKVNMWGSRPSISLTSFSNAYPWDGKPIHRSWYH